MGTGPLLHDEQIALPTAFFECILQDIPVSTWVELLQANPTLRENLLEGFSSRPDKLARFLRQPQAAARLRRFLNSNREALDDILLLWSEERLSVPSFLEMLDYGFLVENFARLKDFLGPERFFAGLCVLGIEGEDVRDLVKDDPDFWKRREGPEVVEPLIPVWNLWRDFVTFCPEARQWMEESSIHLPAPSAGPNAPGGRETAEQPQKEEERRRKIDKRLEKAHDDLLHLREEVARQRKENEEQRKKLADWEGSFQQKLDAAVAKHRHERNLRYQSMDEQPLGEAKKRLESLLRRAERAFELQRQADEQFGLLATVRQELLSVELYLREIERIYADSLVVHSEVTRVKEALILERKRLFSLPGIEKALGAAPSHPLSQSLLAEIRLIEPIPESLSRAARFRKLIGQITALELVDDAQTLTDELDRKKRQIYETLYTRFHPPDEAAAPNHPFRDLDEFTRSGRSKECDLFVDGYNILLRNPDEKQKRAGFSLTAVREEFIDAVQGKSHLFRKVCLVFDGIENSRDRRGNMDIVFTDNPHGTTADSVIIHELKRRREQSALLVTSDEEIIRETATRVYAVVDPFDFHMFVFDMLFPDFPKR